MPFLTVWHQGVQVTPGAGIAGDDYGIGGKDPLSSGGNPTVGGWKSWVIMLPLIWLGFQMEPPQ